MKTETEAWRALQRHAAAQLRRGFSDRVLRAAHGPSDAMWRGLFAAGARRLRPGFADHVLRAARRAVELPSLRSHMVLSAATATVCLCAVLFLHDQSVDRDDARNLAEWERLVEIVGDDVTNV
ncbi:MAG: hypothetical protein JNL39_20095 [Opitutaceae bacterium]|nr:hypothetical protein [Opitutaceae bacterium]